jgi:hypothetical protein
MKTILFPSVAVALLLPLATRAELLVYEGFDPSDSSASLQAGEVAGATSKGFAEGSRWDVLGSEGFVAEFTSDGLSMEGLATAGGALSVGVGNTSSASAVNVFRQSGVSVAPGSTIFGSFLFQNDSSESRYVTALMIETGADEPDDQGTSAGQHRVGDNSVAALVTFSPDSFARDEEGEPGRTTQGVKVGKYESHGSKAIAGSETALENGQPYLVVWSISPTAGGGSDAARTQQAILWVLTQENLAAVRAAGEVTEQTVDANHLVRVVVNDGLRGRLLDTDFLNIWAALAGGKRANSSLYDEIRIGTDIASVLPAP